MDVKVKEWGENVDMGLFRSKEQRIREEQRERQQKQAEQYEQVKQFFRDENVEYGNESDLHTMRLVYDALKKNTDIDTNTYIDTSVSMSSSDDIEAGFSDILEELETGVSNLLDEIETADVNSFRLLKAIIYQNFMIMRKLDALSKQIKTLNK